MGTAIYTNLPSERIFLVCRRMKFFAFILALMAVATAVPAVDDRHDHDHGSASGYDYYGSGSGYYYYGSGSGYDYYGSGSGYYYYGSGSGYDYYGSGYDYYGSGDYGEVWCGGHAAQSCAACPRDTVQLGAMETVHGQMTSVSKVASVVVATKPAPAQSVPRGLVKPGAMETVPGKMTSASQQITSGTTMGLDTTMALVQTTMALDTTMALVQITMETTMGPETTMGLETTMGPVTTLGTVQITRSNTYVRCTCTFDYDYLGLTQQNAAISRKNNFSFSTSDLTRETLNSTSLILGANIQ